jgi:hypothetical protein
MRITEPAEGENAEVKIELIEKTSGKVTADLGTAYARHLSETVLVWSADSKWVAYATRGEREGETSVYFWNGLAFDQIPFPDDPPAPEIKFRKGASGDAKNYGGAVKPFRVVEVRRTRALQRFDHDVEGRWSNLYRRGGVHTRF